ncbi:MAG: peptide deformylase [Bradymonadales bacterium]|nr:peptide deformylase [Bradymonadales bacterium]
MAVLDISLYPDQVLTTPGSDVETVDEDTRRFIDDLTETMYTLNGVGLAANQVNDLRRICVIDTRPGDQPGDRSGLLQLVNPRIVHRQGHVRWEEGCLSFPDLFESVDRAAKVRVEALDREGKPITVEGEELLAVALQHEIDHLDGVVFVDRMSRLKRKMALKRYYRTLESIKSGARPVHSEGKGVL